MKALPKLGYFTSPEQAQPVVDPFPGSTPCPVCGGSMHTDDVRTVSLMPVGGRASAFYRLHRTCAEKLTPEQSSLLDEVALWIAVFDAPCWNCGGEGFTRDSRPWPCPTCMGTKKAVLS